MNLRETIREALYKDRETWLDPDDAEEMAHDIAKAVDDYITANVSDLAEFEINEAYNKGHRDANGDEW
jgi:hypothetical protein